MPEKIVFPNCPALLPITNDKWVVDDNYSAVIHTGQTVSIRKGMETDGASIPRICWRVIGHPFMLPILPCALVHDALYAGELLARNECDWAFLCLMQSAGIGWFKRNTVYSAVRAGGAFVWGKHTVKSICDARKFCKIK